jgi:peptidoglycan/LPS O-acetylase OafA/YrhL
LNPFSPGSLAYRLLAVFYGNIWSGSAAVIVFFVISGFCIHFPFAASLRRPRWKEFYSRRFIRILVPGLLAVPFILVIGLPINFFHQAILWSLLAELIYYTLYPALRGAQLRLGSWRGLVLASFGISLLVAATKYAAPDYPDYGPGLNWLLGLPCWLMGCWLAEAVRTYPARKVSFVGIWGWRWATFAGAWTCSFLRFHSPVGAPWTLNFFAILVACWLYREVRFRASVSPWRWLEWAGLWSYSLYLCHLPASALFDWFFPQRSATAGGWAGAICFVLVICYLFYLAVENPSHLLAKVVSRRFRARDRVQALYSLGASGR